MKTVIHLWNHNANSGIGDLIRGSYGVYLVCKDYGYNFKIDINSHIISNLLISRKSEEMSNIKNVYSVPSRKKLSFFIKKKLQNTDIYLIETNCDIWVYDIPMNEEFRNMIKDILSPKPELYNLIEESFIPNECLHMRLGDEYINGKGDIEKYYDIFRKFYSEGDFFISDSPKFKSYIKLKHPNVKMLNSNPVHLGVSGDLEGIKHTLLELFLVSKCKKIKTYSNYHWVSGFVNSISHVYDIKLINIKLFY